MTGNKIGRTITLMSSDGQLFQVDEAVAKQSQVIETRIKLGMGIAGGEAIPFSRITGKTLKIVIEYCKEQAHSAGDYLKTWEATLAKVGQAMLYDLLIAAHRLIIEGLMELICRVIADLIKGKTVEEMREIFNIESDFTADEEQEIRSQYPWVFDQKAPT